MGPALLPFKGRSTERGLGGPCMLRHPPLPPRHPDRSEPEAACSLTGGGLLGEAPPRVWGARAGRRPACTPCEGPPAPLAQHPQRPGAAAFRGAQLPVWNLKSNFPLRAASVYVCSGVKRAAQGFTAQEWGPGVSTEPPSACACVHARRPMCAHMCACVCPPPAHFAGVLTRAGAGHRVAGIRCSGRAGFPGQPSGGCAPPRTTGCLEAVQRGPRAPGGTRP